MKNWTLLLTVFALSTAHAWEVGTDVKENGEASTCRLLFRDTQNKLTAICSGTLTGTTKITTAGHCVAEVGSSNWKTSVECGYQGNSGTQRVELTSGGSHVLTSGPKFKESRTGSHLKVARTYRADGVGAAGADVGEIEISPPITTIKTVKKIETQAGVDQFFTRARVPRSSNSQYTLKPGVECRSEGYGINNQGTSGLLMSAPLKQTFVGDLSRHSFSTIGKIDVNRFTSDAQVNRYNQCVMAYNNEPLPKNMIPLAKMIGSLKLIKNATTPGDSGGPIYCRKNAQSDWQLLGTTSMGGGNGTEMTTIWATLNNPDLIPVAH